MLRTITPEQLFEKMNALEDFVIVDVRSKEKYNDYHIENSNVVGMNIPKDGIFQLADGSQHNLPELPVNQELIITCTTGNSARKCAEILSERDYHVLVLEGGITAWKEFISKK